MTQENWNALLREFNQDEQLSLFNSVMELARSANCVNKQKENEILNYIKERDYFNFKKELINYENEVIIYLADNHLLEL